MNASQQQPAATLPNQHWLSFGLRAAATILLVASYYWVRRPFGDWISDSFASLDPAFPRVVAVLVLLGMLLAVWWKLVWSDPRFQGPLLITAILAVGDAAFSILENHPAPPWLMQATGGVIRDYEPELLSLKAIWTPKRRSGKKALKHLRPETYPGRRRMRAAA